MASGRRPLGAHPTPRRQLAPAHHLRAHDRVRVLRPRSACPPRLNLLVHAANAALCFLVFRLLTCHRWPSAVVAAVFALHPLRVESVAWISELKDLLCCGFWFVALLAYADWVEHRTRARYALVVTTTVAALLAKPMAVTLPV